MEVIIICAFIAVLLPYLAKAPLAIAMNKESKYDNHYPRDQQARLTGFGARALAAHQNSFESLIVFSVALAIVLSTNNTSITVQILAITYLVARVAYCIMYYINLDKLRSLMWLIGLLCPLTMIGLSLSKLA
ncbi:MAPEG family protein [Pseudoalteromonas sp. C2R02]|uniref:MAPEG family protein n=1 Tax=Pseudoalteromonas sp. C2R02 TaxID=2841565 RepID=UPI001C0871AA|nr:MAPEG family protein [Pseudoalteromonas sp. C2R02]MBU2967763.1 MAPEG family protein [Pseudoalteromonas sp. C2R02]